MAKTNGPLFSMDASGKFAGALVFSKWKGRPTVRQLVTPSNPKTQDQEDARNAVRACGPMQKWANQSLMLYPAATDPDKDRLRDAAPSGQAWNGFLVKEVIGAATLNFTNSQGQYNALTSPEKAAWVAAADALTPAMIGAAQFDANGVPAASLTSGAVFYSYVYGLYIAGLAAAPSGTPPTYT